MHPEFFSLIHNENNCYKSDSSAVMVCAKFHSNLIIRNGTITTANSHQIWIRSEKSLVKWDWFSMHLNYNQAASHGQKILYHFTANHMQQSWIGPSFDYHDYYHSFSSMNIISYFMSWHHVNGFMQERCNSSAPHWNGNVVILTKFSSVAALEVVILTTFSAASDENFIKMKTFPFQCSNAVTSFLH